MPTVTLIRHGQAGARDNYDVLSETGIEQSRLLGEWLIERGIVFDTVLSGGLRRQIETAQAVLGKDTGAGVFVDPSWSEFDIDAVFSGVVPQLAAADAGFAQRWAELQAEVAGGSSDIHRRWTPADGEVMHAWTGGRFGEIEGVESWPAFRGRIRRALGELRKASARTRIAVFTSALPTAFCVADAVGLDQDAILALAGSSYNTGVTTIALDGSSTVLLSFNATCHLPGRLLTFR